jgi:quinol monooxygenase YgiN
VSGFVQIIEYSTSRPEEVEALSAQFRQEREASGDSGGPVRVLVTQDRDRPGTWLNIVQFASYEEAMENSGRPETGRFAERMAELCDGPPRFYNLDLVDTWARAGAPAAAG